MESGYGRPRPSHAPTLTEVGPATPAGVVRDPSRDVVQTRAGNLIVTPVAAGGER